MYVVKARPNSATTPHFSFYNILHLTTDYRCLHVPKGVKNPAGFQAESLRGYSLFPYAVLPPVRNEPVRTVPGGYALGV